MGVVVAATAGICIWVVLWATGIKSFDAFMIAVVLTLAAATVRVLLPHLPGRQRD